MQYPQGVGSPSGGLSSESATEIHPIQSDQINTHVASESTIHTGETRGLPRPAKATGRQGSKINHFIVNVFPRLLIEDDCIIQGIILALIYLYPAAFVVNITELRAPLGRGWL